MARRCTHVSLDKNNQRAGTAIVRAEYSIPAQLGSELEALFDKTVIPRPVLELVGWLLVHVHAPSDGHLFLGSSSTSPASLNTVQHLLLPASKYAHRIQYIIPKFL